MDGQRVRNAPNAEGWYLEDTRKLGNENRLYATQNDCCAGWVASEIGVKGKNLRRCPEDGIS